MPLAITIIIATTRAPETLIKQVMHRLLCRDPTSFWKVIHMMCQTKIVLEATSLADHYRNLCSNDVANMDLVHLRAIEPS